MNNDGKRHFHIDSDASTDEVFTLLDAVQSDNEDENDELMNDFDTKFIAPKEIGLTGNSRQCKCFDIRSKYPCC